MADGNDESNFAIETGAEKLRRLGKTQVISGASPHGGVPVVAVEHPVASYKRQERYTITQEAPEDLGQGYQFTNLNETEV